VRAVGLLVMLAIACGEERAAPETKAPTVAAAAGPRMNLCTAGEEGCAVGPREPVQSYTIPMTPTPAEPPRFADLSPKMAAPAPELPAGCLAVLGSPPRAALEGEAAFEQAVGKQPEPPAVAVKIQPGQKAAVAPDGWAVALGATHQTSVRDGRDGRELVLLGTREQSVSALAFLPDGKRLVVAGSDLRLYDVTTGRQLAERQLVHAEHVAVAPAGGLIATISSGGLATLFSPSLAIRDTASMFPSPTRLAFSADGKLLAALHVSGAVSLWQVDPPALVSGVVGHAVTADAIAVSGGGLVSRGAGRVCRWPEPLGSRPSCLEGYEHAALAPDGAVAIAIGAGVWLYRGDAVTPVARVDPRFGVDDVAFTSGGKRLLVLWGSALEVHDAATGRRLRTVTLPSNGMADVHGATERHALLGRSSDGHLYVADLSGARPVTGPLAFGGYVSSAWAPDGRSAIAASYDMHRFDSSGRVLAALELDGTVRAGAWSPDGRWFAFASDNAVTAFDAADNRARWTSKEARAPIAVVDRGLIAAVDREQQGTILLLDARTGERRGRLDGGELAGWIQGLVLLPRRRLAASAYEGRILLWQVP
jgi:WD40 repeat protein